MKVDTHSTAKPVFRPVSLTVTFESQHELDSFTQLFNGAALSELPGRFQMYSAAKELGGSDDLCATKTLMLDIARRIAIRYS